jgi:hypothetical protein
MTLADQLGTGRGFVEDLNLWNDTAAGGYTISVGLSDNLSNWTDVIAKAGAINFIEPLNNWADELTVTLSKSYSVPADALAGYSDQFGQGKGFSLTDDAANLADSRQSRLNYLTLLSDSMTQSDSAAVTLGKLFGLAPDDAANLGDSLNVFYGFFDQVYAQFTENLNNWTDSAAGSKQYIGLHLQGKAVESLAFSGRVVESVQLSGKTAGQVLTGGKLYTGDVSGV